MDALTNPKPLSNYLQTFEAFGAIFGAAPIKLPDQGKRLQVMWFHLRFVYSAVLLSLSIVASIYMAVNSKDKSTFIYSTQLLFRFFTLGIAINLFISSVNRSKL